MISTITRKPAVAGRFYPGDASSLRSTIEGFLGSSGVVAAPSGVRCVLVPHAGYVYSALTAAHAYVRVRGKRVDRVILLGCSHRYSFGQSSSGPGFHS
jgi:hypothetical protein